MICPDLHAFWASDEWRAYEALHDGPPGTRSALLAAADWDTHVVDLRPSEAELWRGVRRSYHSLIARHRAGVRVYGAGQQDYPNRYPVDAAAAIHLEAAGRVTRPIGTWDLMAGWLASGDALCALAWVGDDVLPVGYAYAVRHAGWSYYLSGAAVRRDISHALVWGLMRALRCDGRTRWFEVGWAERPGDGDKDRGIAMFKSGFGGERWRLCDATLSAR